jgi:hypothetical protein
LQFLHASQIQYFSALADPKLFLIGDPIAFPAKRPLRLRLTVSFPPQRYQNRRQLSVAVWLQKINLQPQLPVLLSERPNFTLKPV